MQDWIRAAGIKGGLLLRSNNRHGTLVAAQSGQCIALIVKQHADQAGLDPREFAGHRLRAGFLTGVAEAGVSMLRTMEVSRHKRVKQCRGIFGVRVASKETLERRSFEWS